jgi:hypothetical protein
VSLLPQGTKTQHAPDDFGHQEGFAKTEIVAGQSFFPHRALCGKLKPKPLE